MQPGITDVKSQVQAMAPFVTANLGKKVTMVFPDFAFGHDHRDYFTAAVAAQGGEVIAQIAIPPTETSFTRYFPQIPAETEVLYHVMVGPAVLTFVKEIGEFYGSGAKPQLFGFMDSLEAVDIKSPGLEFLEGSHFWEAQPRYKPVSYTHLDVYKRQAHPFPPFGAQRHRRHQCTGCDRFLSRLQQRPVVRADQAWFPTAPHRHRRFVWPLV